jgi:hypothetical protein
MNNTLKLAGAFLALALGTVAQAASINGRIDIGAFGSPIAIDYTAKTVDFVDGNNAIVSFADGDYAAFTPPAITLVSYKDFAYNGTGLPQMIWEIDATTYFTLSSITSVVETANGLVLQGLGVATLGMFDPTPGLWSFSADRNLGETLFSFSSTTQVPPPAVPESGASIALLGSALVAMGLISRRRRA